MSCREAIPPYVLCPVYLIPYYVQQVLRKQRKEWTLYLPQFNYSFVSSTTFVEIPILNLHCRNILQFIAKSQNEVDTFCFTECYISSVSVSILYYKQSKYYTPRTIISIKIHNWYALDSWISAMPATIPNLTYSTSLQDSMMASLPPTKSMSASIS